MGIFDQQFEKVKTQAGFIAALDQSGGSTPKALKLYGVDETAYDTDDQMFDQVHQMRTRIVTSPSFSGERVLGAILFENTLDRQIKEKMTSQYLWENKGVVPFLKVDKGLSDEEDGVQVMKPIPALDTLLDKAVAQNVFGTKMRSLIKTANPIGIGVVVAQQFEVGKRIIARGLVPIIEPEIDINSPQKVEAEMLLRDELMMQLDALSDDQQVMLKLTLPEQDGFYCACVSHPNVLKVVALSGGYSREEANRRTSCNEGVIASFSRALTQGLQASFSDDEFDLTLNDSINDIYKASIT